MNTQPPFDYRPLLLTTVVLFFNATVGQLNKRISDFHNVGLTPNPKTFTIWGIIYGLLTYNAFAHSGDFKNILFLYGLSSVLNVLWLKVFTNCSEEKHQSHPHVIYASIILSMIAMSIWILVVFKTFNLNPSSQIAFSIYAAWTTVASLLNFSIAIKENTSINENIITNFILSILSIIPLLVTNLKLNKTILTSLFLTWIWASFGIFNNGKHIHNAWIPIFTNCISLCNVMLFR